MLAYSSTSNTEQIQAMRDFADGLLERLERGERAPAAAAATPEAGPTPADRALQVLYEDGTERLGSLWFLEAAVRFPAGQGYTIAEIAQALEVESGRGPRVPRTSAVRSSPRCGQRSRTCRVLPRLVGRGGGRVPLRGAPGDPRRRRAEGPHLTGLTAAENGPRASGSRR